MAKGKGAGRGKKFRKDKMEERGEAPPEATADAADAEAESVEAEAEPAVKPISLGIARKGAKKPEAPKTSMSVQLNAGPMRDSDRFRADDERAQQRFTIKADNFDVIRGTSKLLDGASITLSFGRRYGIVAPNGSGKTSVMEAIAHREIPGIPEHISILLVEQEAESTDMSARDYVIAADVERTSLLAEKESLEGKDEGMTEDDVDRYSEVLNRLKEIGAFQAEARAAIILHGLQFTDEMMAAATKTFSGGWRMRIALARALFARPDLLLLDEPTNHLDLFAAVWLEEFLSRWKKTLVMVSHDRELLNYVCTDIYQIYQQKLHHYRGNYDSFTVAFMDKRRTQEKAYDKQQKRLSEVKRLQVNVAQGEAQAKARATVKGQQQKGKKVEKAGKSGGNDGGKNQARANLKAKENALEREDAVEKPSKLYAPEFFFPDAGEMPYPVINVKEAAFHYPPRAEGASAPEVLRDLDFCIDNTSRVTLVGRNGVGKSTLLKLLTGELHPTTGEVLINPRLRFGRFNQHLVDQLDASVSAVEYLMKKYDLKDVGEVRKRLGGYGLHGDQHVIPIDSLSGGQKVRVAFTELYYQRPHILFLDEPTNHLDIESVDALIDAIAQFPGAVVVITHNQALIKKACEQIWIVEDQKISIFRESYEKYMQQLLEKLEFLDEEDE